MDNTRQTIREIEEIINNTEFDNNNLALFALLYKKLGDRESKKGLMDLVQDYCMRPLW